MVAQGSWAPLTGGIGSGKSFGRVRARRERTSGRQPVRRNVQMKRPFEGRQDTRLRQTATVHRLSGHDLTFGVKVHELAGSLSSAVDV